MIAIWDGYISKKALTLNHNLENKLTNREELGIKDLCLAPRKIVVAKTMAFVVFRGHITVGVKIHMVFVHLFVGLKYFEIKIAYEKPLSTIHNWLQRFLKGGIDLLVRRKQFRVKKLTPYHYKWIKNFILKNPLSYLREIQKAFYVRFFKVSYLRIFNILFKLNITRRVLELRALKIHTRN